MKAQGEEREREYRSDVGELRNQLDKMDAERTELKLQVNHTHMYTHKYAGKDLFFNLHW